MPHSPINILWFRNGLRLHDNGSLVNATKDSKAALMPLFIWDGVTPVTEKCGYNKIAFLLECLEDIDYQLREVGSRLYFIKGDPVQTLKAINKEFKIELVCFDQDCEPVWLERDNNVKNYCAAHKIDVEEDIGATLWDPLMVIQTNGGTPPLTFSQFCHVTKGMGQPRRPLKDVNLKKVKFVELDEFQMKQLGVYPKIPSPEDLGFVRTNEKKVYRGGETVALKFFIRRMKHEINAFMDGSFLPNRRDPDILNPPKSLSPDLKFGCLSVKMFYWAIMDTYKEVHRNGPEPSYIIVNQLIWREFFYVMSANNPFYGEMDRNPICITIPWNNNQKHLDTYLEGKTGFPFIDAGVRQLNMEGWVHHIIRNSLSMFLTRGDLWLNWEHGLSQFLSKLIDADWAVSAGNWMWVSSSAFEKALNYSYCLDPRVYGKRFDPDGLYIKKYVPELANFPTEFIYEPWKAPKEVQEKAGCIIGKDYPPPMVDHNAVWKRNSKLMLKLQEKLLKSSNMEEPPHIRPSSNSEIREFFRILDPDFDQDNQLLNLEDLANIE